MEERYAYEEAEKKLDAFAKRIKSRPFHRAYRKFKVLVKVFAYCDFSAPNLPTEEHLSWAWEDVELAFKGLGDSTLHGCIVQMWSCLSPQEKKFFLSTVKIGFSEAEAATGEDVARRYLFRYRRKPVRNPELGYNYQMTPPLQGVQLKNWEVEEETNPEDHRDFLDGLFPGERHDDLLLLIQDVRERKKREMKGRVTNKIQE